MHGDDVVESKWLIGSDLQNHRQGALAGRGCKRHGDRCSGRCLGDRAAVQKYLRRPAEAAQVEYAAAGLHALPRCELTAIQHIAGTFGALSKVPGNVLLQLLLSLGRRGRSGAGGCANAAVWRQLSTTITGAAIGTDAGSGADVQPISSTASRNPGLLACRRNTPAPLPACTIACASPLNNATCVL